MVVFGGDLPKPLKCALCMSLDPNALPATGKEIEDAVTVVQGTAVCSIHLEVPMAIHAGQGTWAAMLKLARHLDAERRNLGE